MKRIYLLVICLVALLMPQFAYAQAVLNNDTLTVTTTQVGQVAGYISDLNLTSEQKASVTSIVLIGKFGKYNNYQDDLDSLGYNHGFTAVTTVDMSEAKFVNTTAESAQNPNRWVKSEAYTSVGSGTHAFVGGNLYQFEIDRVWNELNYDPGNTTEYATVADMNSAASSSALYAKAKVPQYMYCQMIIPDNEEWTNVDDVSHDGAIQVNWLENELNNRLYLYTNDQIIAVKRYYYKENGEWGMSPVYPTSTEGHTVHDGSGVGATELDWDNNAGGNGDYIFFWHYYKKVGTRTWTEGTTTEQAGATIGNFAYNDRYNSENMNYPNGTWVKMTNGYTYYQLEYQSGAEHRRWKDVTENYDFMDNNIIGHYDNSSSLPIYEYDNSNDGKYAIVGGGEKISNGSGWYDIGESEEVPNYAVMTFTYWQETITTAITSKYANETISDQIFQNCKKLTYVDYKAGNVIGFQDHKLSDGYNTNNTTLATGLSVTIGKNVTKISSAAFQRCDVLTSLAFDKDYDSSNPDMLTGVTYPVNLVIGEAAFQACSNLSGVEFPNRVTSIGNTAFEHAGDNVDEFTVSFERRSLDFGPDVSIAYFVNLTIGNSAFAYCSKLKTISLPIRLESMGNNAFANSGLEHFEIREDREDSYLTVIPSGAFSYTKLQEIVIPRSVTEIMGSAFSNTPTVKTIIFQESNKDPQPSLYIHTGAFAGGNEQDSELSDVYVNIDPSKRKMICEYDAFNFTYLVGQTSSNDTMAKLHFPEEFWDYYQGEWKRGIAFTQDMLTRFKDGYRDDNITPQCVGMSNGSIGQSGKYETGDVATQYAPANGWQQFAQSYSTIDIVLPLGLFLRSYSTPIPLAIPVFPTEGGNTYHHMAGDPMFRVYRITNFDDGAMEAAERPGESVTPTATATEIAERVGGNGALYIPANTGVILVGYIDPSYMVYLSKIENAEVDANVTYPFNETIDSDSTNLLYPTCIDIQRPEGTDIYKDGAPKVLKDSVNGETCVQLNPTIPYPYTTSAHPLQYRLFGLSSSTQGSFNRLKKDVKMSRDKAYLKLNTNLFHYSNEGADASGSGVPIGSSSAPIMMTFVDEGGETTDVRLVDPVTMTFVDDCYYTLQGVKLNVRPTQAGIYIHNGKKIVIK